MFPDITATVNALQQRTSAVQGGDSIEIGRHINNTLNTNTSAYRLGSRLARTGMFVTAVGFSVGGVGLLRACTNLSPLPSDFNLAPLPSDFFPKFVILMRGPLLSLIGVTLQASGLSLIDGERRRQESALDNAARRSEAAVVLLPV